jgi:hypothetical protein
VVLLAAKEQNCSLITFLILKTQAHSQVVIFFFFFYSTHGAAEITRHEPPHHMISSSSSPVKTNSVGAVRQTRANAATESIFLRGRPPPSPQSGLFSRPRSGSASSRSSSATGRQQPQRLRSPKDTQRSLNNSPSTAPSPVHGASRPHSTESAHSSGSGQGRTGSGGRVPASPGHNNVGGVWNGKVASRGQSPSSPTVHRNEKLGSHKAMVAPPVGRGAARSRHSVLRQRATLGLRTGVRVLPWQEGGHCALEHDSFVPVPLSSASEDFVSYQETAVDQWGSSSSSDDDDNNNAAAALVAVVTATHATQQRPGSRHTFDDDDAGSSSDSDSGRVAVAVPRPLPCIAGVTLQQNHRVVAHDDDDSSSDDSSEEEFEIAEQMAAPRLSCALGGELGAFGGGADNTACAGSQPTRTANDGRSSVEAIHDDDDPAVGGPCYAEKYRRSVQSLGQLNNSQPFRFI